MCRTEEEEEEEEDKGAATSERASNNQPTHTHTHTLTHTHTHTHTHVQNSPDAGEEHVLCAALFIGVCHRLCQSMYQLNYKAQCQYWSKTRGCRGSALLILLVLEPLVLVPLLLVVLVKESQPRNMTRLRIHSTTLRRGSAPSTLSSAAAWLL